jgi:16S rRNA (guanine1207-N2)-methyltransferase
VGTTSHYFDREPAVPSQPGRVELVLPDLDVTLATDRGVFSAGAIDPGTKLLLLDGPRPEPGEAGHLLDLGCGYGPIAIALARRAPAATVWAIDVNERALTLCRANAAAAGVSGVRAVLPEEIDPAIVFAGIWSNPPVRIGKAGLHALLEQWLPRLAPGAAAHLVVQKHLGADSLAAWLRDAGWSVDRVAARTGYRLLDVRAA